MNVGNCQLACHESAKLSNLFALSHLSDIFEYTLQATGSVLKVCVGNSIFFIIGKRLELSVLEAKVDFFELISYNKSEYNTSAK